MKFGCLLMLCAALPAAADISFQVRRVKREDVVPGKGQCDIRLRVPREVDVTVRGDRITAHPVSGRDARDQGSECNLPLPNKDIRNFRFEVLDGRNDTRLIEEPGPGNNFAVLVRIRDTSDGEVRHHFRLTWSAREDNDRPPTAPGFSWNNTVSFKGTGRGRASLNNAPETPLREVAIEVDRGGKFAIWFKPEGRGSPLTFTGQLVSNESGRWKVDAMSEDRRLRGPMWITVDGHQKVDSVSFEGTDGRDRLTLSWNRR